MALADKVKLKEAQAEIDKLKNRIKGLNTTISWHLKLLDDISCVVRKYDGE